MRFLEFPLLVVGFIAFIYAIVHFYDWLWFY
jgi:hypothetical protein